ncbi:MAG: ferritin family protein [Polyangiaceae bacterium]
MGTVRLAKILYLAEHLGGVFYDRFSESVENGDISGTFSSFAGDEHHHADWYAGWLREKGHEPPVPTAAALRALVLPPLRLALAPQPLERKLVTFSRTEATAARHLRSLAPKVKDPELRAIIERTIPFEEKHARWYTSEGRRMLRPQDSR